MRLVRMCLVLGTAAFLALCVGTGWVLGAEEVSLPELISAFGEAWLTR